MIKFLREWLVKCVLGDLHDGYFIANAASIILTLMLLTVWGMWAGEQFSLPVTLKLTTLPMVIYLLSMLQFYFSEYRSKNKDD